VHTLSRDIFLLMGLLRMDRHDQVRAPERIDNGRKLDLCFLQAHLVGLASLNVAGSLPEQ